MKKETLLFDSLYVSINTPEDCEGYILYVHGGPGNHSAYFELILHDLPEYKNHNLGWICYDQRGCGRSNAAKNMVLEELSHSRNINDLAKIYKYLKGEKNMNIKALLGHSYGAWLAYEAAIEIGDKNLPIVLVGLSESITHPRNRSLFQDLFYLKVNQPDEYHQILEEMDSNPGASIWKMAKKVRSSMKTTDMRKYFYWANLKTLDYYERIKASSDLMETNDEVFRQVRRDLYKDEESLTGPHLDKIPSQKVAWINGFHDFLMGGENVSLKGQENLITFYKSGHYPHIEEPGQFVSTISDFLREAT